MEIRLLEEKDIPLLKDIFNEDGKVLNHEYVKNFLNTPNAYAFILEKANKIIGFSYCHGLVRPDGKKMFYLHDIGLLEKERDKGMGTEMMRFIVNFAKNNGFSEVFLITDYNNPRACHVYEKVGFTNEIANEVCYVYEFDNSVLDKAHKM